MFVLNRRAPPWACDREDLCPDSGALPFYGDVLTFEFDRAFTLDQVAERIGASLRQVQALVASGRLKAFDVGLGIDRRSPRVTDEELEEFVRRHRITQPQATPPGRPRTIITRRR